MWRVLKPMIVAAFAAAILAAAGQTAEPGCVEWSQAGPDHRAELAHFRQRRLPDGAETHGR